MGDVFEARFPVMVAGNVRSITGWRATNVNLTDFAALCEAPSKCEKNDAPAFFAGILSGGRRQKRNFVSRSAIVLDADHGSRKDFVGDRMRAANLAGIVWETASSSFPSPRFRVVLPCTRSMTAGESEAIAKICFSVLGPVAQWDGSCAEASRAFFLPSHHLGLRVRHWLIDGARLNVGKWLENIGYEEKDDGDVSLSSVPDGGYGGAIGEFNSKYGFNDLVRLFGWPYESVGRRWRYTRGGDTAPGVTMLDSGLVYSHHADDPLADGRAHTIFDCMRLLECGGDVGAAVGRALSLLQLEM